MKIKIVSVLIVILILAMYVPVYAETTLPAPPNDVYEYWVYYIDEDLQQMYFGTSHTPITVTKTGNEINFYGGKYYIYNNDEWVIWREEAGDVFIPELVIVAANHDIAYQDGSGFFFLSPKVSQLIRTMKKTDFGTILRNFSTGLIPILGLMILAISLYKAWGFLRNQLMN